jgi:hypothetical protein
MATSSDQSTKSYENQIKSLKNSLASSPTAYTRNVSPSKQDLSKEVQLRKAKEALEKAKSAGLEEKWYGDQNKTATPRKKSIFERGLHMLGTPLYGIVGGLESVLGKGSQKGLFQNIKANVEEEETFGDLLRKYQLPGFVSAPVGFALDVAFDPVNWATVGTSALIPRVVSGAMKGGLKGAEKGLVSGVLKKASTVSKYTPFLRKGVSPKLADRAFNAAREYEDVVGTDVMQQIIEKYAKPEIWDTVKGKLEKFPTGQKVLNQLEHWRPQNKEWMAEAKRVEDSIRETMNNPNSIVVRNADDVDNAMEAARSSLNEGFGPLLNLRKEVPEVTAGIKKNVSEGVDLATDSSHLARTSNHADNGSRMAGEYLNNIETSERLAAEAAQRTGVQWYDDLIDKINDFKIGDKEVGRKALETYQALISVFKIAKVPLSPAAYTYAILGNPIMAKMAGINIASPAYLKLILQAKKLMAGKNPEMIKGLMKNDDVVKFLEEYPTLFTRSFGFSPGFMKKQGAFWEVVEEGNRLSQISKAKAGDVRKASKDWNDFTSAWEKRSGQFAELATGMTKSGRIRPTTGGQLVRSGQLTAETLPTTFTQTEIMPGGFNAWKVFIDKKASEGNLAGKILKAAIEKPMDMYERIDQTYKFSTFAYLADMGVSEQELKLLNRWVKLSPDEITKIRPAGGADYLYKIKPIKAVEIAHEIYMNYQAMPGAVKVLRTLPFLGSPFASFMYGMGVKTGKAAVKNTAIFNKVNFLLKEASGQNTPLEKEALDQPYYQWYKRGGMVKLPQMPFFRDNPVYLNVANMLPYYTLNIFQPSERDYSEEGGGAGMIANAIDKLPILKTPEGQVFFDYFIQPLILQDSDPKGMFGQQLWPSDANALEKTGYAARALGEAVVPGALSYAGLVTPESALEYMPSYRWRNIGYATRGKTSLGISASEAPGSRTLRSLLSSVGMSTYPLRTEFVSNEVKKEASK